MIKQKKKQQNWKELAPDLYTHIQKVFNSNENTPRYKRVGYMLHRTSQVKQHLFGKIIDSSRVNKENSGREFQQLQKSLSENRLLTTLKEQQTSFIQKKQESQWKTKCGEMKKPQGIFVAANNSGVGSLSGRESPSANEKSNESSTELFGNLRISQIQKEPPPTESKARSMSPSQQTNPDQTFSPFHPGRTVQIISPMRALQLPPPKDVCVIEGHEQNEIKFICVSEGCVKRFSRGCAYCMLKWHAKHLDEMQEIGAFERSLKDRMEEAKVMYQDNLDLLSDLSVHPFQSFFVSLKREVMAKIEALESRVSSLYRQQLNLKLESEIAIVTNFNAQFEGWQKQSEPCELLAGRELWARQEQAREQIKNHMIARQIPLASDGRERILQQLEDSVIGIIHTSMGAVLDEPEKKKKLNHSTSQLSSVISTQRQWPTHHQVLRKVSSPSIIKEASPEKSEQTIVPVSIHAAQNSNRSKSYHMLSPPQLVLSPRPHQTIIFSQISSPRIYSNRIQLPSPPQQLLIVNK